MVPDRQATTLFAHTYMHMSMGRPVDCPLGYPSNPRRRLCQRGTQGGPAPAPSSQQEEAERQERCCGQAEHAGTHGSVFEAAACAFARQRRQRAEAAAEAAAAAGMRRLSVGAAGGSGCAGASPVAARQGPGSPPLASAPTPTNAGSSAAAAAAAAAPAVQPTARVRHVGIGKRVASRRTLFDIAAEGDAAGRQQPALGEGSKAPADAADSAAVALQQAAAMVSRAGTAAVDMVAGVALEQAMSPRHASLRAMAQRAAAAAAPPQPAGWESRKRLRFD